MKNNKGFSVIGMLLLCVVIVLCGIAASSIIQSQKMQQKLLFQKLAVIELESTVRSIMNAPNLCRCNMANKIISPSRMGSDGLEIEKLNSYTNNNCNFATSKELLEKDKKYSTSDLEITSIKLLNPRELSLNLFYIDLKVSVLSVRGQPMRPIEVKNILFKIVDNSRVVECSSNKVHSLAASACQKNEIFSGVKLDGSPNCKSNTSPLSQISTCPHTKYATGFTPAGILACTK